MIRRLSALIFCCLACVSPAVAQTAPDGESGDASLICFLVLMEASVRQATDCGRRLTEVETRRYQGVHRRLQGYVLERSGPRGPDILQGLRQQMAGGATACGDASLPLANRFVDEVLGDEQFPAQLEETLRRDPNPLSGGCL